MQQCITRKHPLLLSITSITRNGRLVFFVLSFFLFYLLDGKGNTPPICKVGSSPVSPGNTIKSIIATDIDGDDLNFSVISSPMKGVLTIDNNDNTYSYTAQIGVSGTDFFTINVSDGTDTITCTVFILILPDTLPPVCFLANFSLFPGDTVSDLIAIDGDSDELNFSVISLPTQGTLQINGDDRFSYTADTDASGDDSFTIDVSDGDNTTSCTVNIAILSGGSGGDVQEIVMLKNWDYGEPGESLTFNFFISITTLNVVNGIDIVTPKGKNYSIIPGSDMTGEKDTEAGKITSGGGFSNGTTKDWFLFGEFDNEINMDNNFGDGDYMLTFSKGDGSDLSTVIPFSLPNGDPIPQPEQKPTFSPAIHNTIQPPSTTFSWESITDSALTGDGPGEKGVFIQGFLQNNNDDFAEDLSVSTASYDATNLTEGPWEVQLDFLLGFPDQKNIDDILFSVGKIGISRHSFTVQEGNTNHPPACEVSDFSMGEGQEIQGQLNATDDDGDPLSFTETFAPDHGTLTLNLDGTFIYQPDTGFVGSDSFTYTVTDDFGASPLEVCTANITVESTAHDADQNQDFEIQLSPELTRIIQFFNSGGYHCQEGTEDGFAPGLGSEDCAPHDADQNQDFEIQLSPELTRLIQFFNSGGYHCQEGTEDGFAPGKLTESGN